MRIALALLATALALPAALGQAQLLPAGEFAARDGRPGPGKTWRVSDEQGRALAAQLNATAAKTPIVIDYDHQTLRAEANGQAAPAAGWIHQAEWRDGEGLFARVEWTAPAKARIEAGEYRYISPVITSDAQGHITGLHLAALVNHPALLGMEPVLAQLSAQLSALADAQDPFVTKATKPKESEMDLKLSIITALALAAGLTDAQLLDALKDLKARADAPPKAALPAALATALGLTAEAGQEQALSAVAALKGGEASTLQAMTALQGQVAALTAQINEGAVVGLVDAAIDAKKLLPAQREWALGLGRTDRTALQGYLDASPVIPGLAGQTPGQPEPGTGGGTHALSAVQLGIARQLGIEPEAYAKQLKAAA